MTIALHCVLKGLGENSPIKGLQRVLWINNEIDEIYFIEIPTWEKDKSAPRYYKGPSKHSLSKLEETIASGDICITTVLPPTMAGWTDDQIRKRYPMRTKEMKSKRPRTDCAVLQFRDERWKWAQPIVEYIDATPDTFFKYSQMASLIRARAEELGRSTIEIYDAVHRVLAHACGKNSLLPAFCRCGGSNKDRSPKNALRLGRPNAAFNKGDVPSSGINLSIEDKRHLAFGHTRFLKQGRSVQEAYILTMGAWWSSGSKIEDGMEVPILLPAYQRPTVAQFRYWGTSDTDGKSAYELLLKDGDWELKFRAMLGSSLDGLNGIGQMGVMDATGSHVTFVSTGSALDAIGKGHRIVIHDGLSEVITGFYVGLEAPSESTANLAAYNSASDKVDLFERFGLTITSEQVPACHYRKIRLDNGEGRNKGFMGTMTAAGTALEYVRRRRAELKQQAESGHHSLHALLDDHLDGATHGRSPGRGEDHSAIAACWTWYNYMVEFLRAVIYYNCHADASSLLARHPFRTEMVRDNVQPNRSAIYEWCVKNNRVSIPAHDIEIIRSKCLPSFKAIVKQTGIYLCRPDRGAKTELVVGPRFIGRRSIELRWHEGVRSDFQIEIRMDPNDTSKAWYYDELGIHCFENRSADRLALRTATLHDLLSMQDAHLIKNIASRTQSDQDQSDFVSHRENKNLELRSAKKKVIEQKDGKVSKASLKGNLSENRIKESHTIARQIDPVTRAPKNTSTKHVNPELESNTGDINHSLDSLSSNPEPLESIQKDSPNSSPGTNEDIIIYSSKSDVVADALSALRARRSMQ